MTKGTYLKQRKFSFPSLKVQIENFQISSIKKNVISVYTVKSIFLFIYFFGVQFYQFQHICITTRIREQNGSIIPRSKTTPSCSDFVVTPSHCTLPPPKHSSFPLYRYSVYPFIHWRIFGLFSAIGNYQ